VIRWAFHA